MPHRKRLWKSIVPLLISTALTVCLIELYVKHVYEKPMEFKKDTPLNPDELFVYEKGVKRALYNLEEDLEKIDSNAIFWHSFDVNDLKKSTAEYNIVLIGDSVTDQIDWSYMADRLRSMGTECNVFAFACGAYNLHQMNYVMNHIVLEHLPEKRRCFIIYNFFQNDTNLHHIFYSDGQIYIYYDYLQQPYLFDIPGNAFLLRHSSTYAFVNRRISDYLKIHPAPFNLPFVMKNYKESIDRSADQLKGMIQKARSKDIDFLVVNMPYLAQNFLSEPFIETVASQLGQEWYDIRNTFIEWGLDKDGRIVDMRSSPKDFMHYSAHGATLVQNAIIEYLVETGRVPAIDER